MSAAPGRSQVSSHRSAQREGTPVSAAPGRSQASSHRSAQHEGTRLTLARAPMPERVAPGLQTFLALDFGLKRTGVAVGNRMLKTAQPQASIHAEGDARFDKIAAHLREWQPDALVVGVPFHPDGAEHENTLRARRFGRQLAGRFKLPVFEVDERYSTTEALSLGAKDADAMSACIILEQFLRGLG